MWRASGNRSSAMAVGVTPREWRRKRGVSISRSISASSSVTAGCVMPIATAVRRTLPISASVTSTWMWRMRKRVSNRFRITEERGFTVFGFLMGTHNI